MTHPSEHDACDAHDDGQQSEIDAIVAGGPAGAFAVAGVATFIVVAIFYLFYVFVYLPRGTVQ